MKGRLKYNYIAVEGNIGAGKTSLARILAKEFSTNLLLEDFKKNPFLESFYKSLEGKVFPTEMFFLFDRYEQLKKVNTGRKRLVSDFSFAKTLVFAENNLTPAEFKVFKNYHNVLNETLPQPDLLIYLHSDIDRLIHNIHQRGRKMEQSISVGYLFQLEKRYIGFLKKQKTSVLYIDSTKSDFIKDKSARSKIIEYVSMNLPKKLTKIKL